MSEATKVETTTVEVWVMVDENGDYVASHDVDQLGELYGEHIGELAGVSSRRIKITLTVPLPRPVELVGTVGEEAAGGTLVAAN